ncbi:hypothetical protein GW17_00008048 [Ensete ventricosum]|nr:hypothetical protein GW17_00008048 [Ensete ventricosum]RZS04572.1 hypothetical protein BHM03_00034926 [Ensete ventricosum]
MRGRSESERGAPLPGGRPLRGRQQGHLLLLLGGRRPAPVRQGGPDQALLRDPQLLGHPAQTHPPPLRYMRPPPRPRLRRRASHDARPRPVRVRP